MTRTTRTRRPARAAAAAAAVLSLTIAGCSDSAGPEAGAVTTEDLEQLQDEVGALDERLGTLEEGLGSEGVGVGADAGAAGEVAVAEAQDLVGEVVTISAQVTETITTTDVGSAFRVAGEDGTGIPVLAQGVPSDISVDDVVRVSGTVTQVQETTFEEDFGYAADELFEDAAGFFDSYEGQVAVNASEIEAIQEQASS